MLERGKMDRDLVEFVVIDQLVPKEHLLRKIAAAVDFTQLYEMEEPLYCEDNGRPSIDPVVLFKMVLIQHLYGLPSLRRTADEVSANNCYRWFLGYPLQEETPHFSTVSYNFRHRFTEETVDRVFAWILDEVAKAGYLSPKAVFIDGTHIKANANTKKQVKEQIPAAARHYAKELMEEVNADMEMLSPLEQEIFSSCLLGEMPIRQFAERNGMRKSTAWDMANAIRKKLQEIF